MEYPAQYLAKWDRETQSRRLTGVAANDCHHNMVMIVKMVDGQTVKVGTIVDKDEDMRTMTATLRPGIRELTRGHKPGDVVARVDFDPYHRSFQNVSTHVLAPELTEKAIRDALRQGQAYVSHDWICDPTGFRFELIAGSSARGRIETGAQGTVPMGGDIELHWWKQAARGIPRVLPHPPDERWEGDRRGAWRSARMEGHRAGGLPYRGLVVARRRGTRLGVLEPDLHSPVREHVNSSPIDASI